jgi:ParB family chromosome partitioning protein
MFQRLRRSVEKFGLVAPLVVRRIGKERYETIGGAQRLRVLVEMGVKKVLCVIVEADNAEARLLSQALNLVQGRDNLGLRAEVLRQMQATIPSSEILSILPETPESLNDATNVGRESLDSFLEAWGAKNRSRLRHLTFQLSSDQIEVVEKVIRTLLPKAARTKKDSPNDRGTALYLLCQQYLKRKMPHEK